jgi:hypothetical protein
LWDVSSATPRRGRDLGTSGARPVSATMVPMRSAAADDIYAILDSDEIIVALGWAEVRMPRQGILTVVPIGSLIRLGYVIVNKRRAADLRKRTATDELPLDRHMGVVLTSQRLMTWSATRYPRRRKALLGHVPRHTINSVTLPYSSSGPHKTVVIQMRGDPAIRFRVDASLAEALVREFKVS